jgi:hypothetical protein
MTASSRSNASADTVIRLLAGRWTPAILGQLRISGRRYQDLFETLDGISYQVLTETLRRERSKPPESAGTHFWRDCASNGTFLSQALAADLSQALAAERCR